MKTTRLISYTLLAIAVNVSTMIADDTAVDDAHIAPTGETVKKFEDNSAKEEETKKKGKKNKEAKENEPEESNDDKAKDESDKKTKKEEKKTKKDEKAKESFAGKSKKRIEAGNSEDRAQTKKKLTENKEASAEDRKKTTEKINQAYKAAEIMQKQADDAMKAAQSTQKQADESFFNCLLELCDGIHKGAFNIGEDEDDGQISKKADEIETLKTTIEDMRKTKEKMRKGYEDAINKTDACELIISSLEGNIAQAVEGEPIVADDAKMKLEIELAQARSDLLLTEQKLTMANSALSSLKAAKLKDSIKAKTGEIDKLRKEKAAAEEKVKEIEGKITKLPKKEIKEPDVSKLSEDLNKERLRLKKAVNAQKTLKEKIETIQKEIDENQAQIAPLEEALRKFVTDSALKKLGTKDTKVAKKLKEHADI